LAVDKASPVATPRLPAPGYRRLAWMAAAVFLAVAGGVAFYWISKNDKNIKTVASVPYKNDVLPGGNKAILTLANGQQIALDSAANGMLVLQGGAQVTKEGDGLKYDESPKSEAGSQKSEDIAYNILSTPRGGQYKLVLPDGSKVWLNAASSIKYPTVFIGNERRVEISGEAYFEVAKLQGKKFIVSINRGAEVEVLGTHFNINAYNDEAVIKTTLLEGKVKVKPEGDSHRDRNPTSDLRLPTSVFLNPGEQAMISSANHPIDVAEVDTDEIVAWTNGMFIFRDQDIQTIMRQISRWYDVQISYEKTMVKEKFNATIPRSVPVSKVLHLLEMTEQVHFKIEGKKIIVQP
jgi:transmembrane sensor